MTRTLILHKCHSMGISLLVVVPQELQFHHRLVIVVSLTWFITTWRIANHGPARETCLLKHDYKVGMILISIMEGRYPESAKVVLGVMTVLECNKWWLSWKFLLLSFICDNPRQVPRRWKHHRPQMTLRMWWLEHWLGSYIRLKKSIGSSLKM